MKLCSQTNLGLAKIKTILIIIIIIHTCVTYYRVHVNCAKAFRDNGKKFQEIQVSQRSGICFSDPVWKDLDPVLIQFRKRRKKIVVAIPGIHK